MKKIPVRHFFLIPLFSIALSPWLAGQTMELQFQEGLNDYAGTRDTTFRGGSSGNHSNYTKNYGGSQVLTLRQGQYNSDTKLGGQGLNTHTILINFEDIFGSGPGQINHEIVEAQLVLTAFAANGVTRTLSLGALMKPFVEGDGGSYNFDTNAQTGTHVAGASTWWFQYAPEDSWDSGVLHTDDETHPDSFPYNPYIEEGTLWGNNDPNEELRGPRGDIDFFFSDHPDYAVDTVVSFAGSYDTEGPSNQVFDTPVPVTIDVTTILKAWQDGDIPQYGFFLYNDVANAPYYDFFSSEYAGDAELRPMLLVTVVPEPGTVALIFSSALLVGFLALRHVRRRPAA